MSKVAVTAVAHLLRAQTSIEERLTNSISAIHGVSLRELMVLMFLENAPATRMSRVELARCMNVSASTITRQLAPMTKIGLVDKATDPRDARLSYVVLSKAGARLAKDARKSLEASAREVFKDRWLSEEISQ
ncbi:MAG: MarR family transcriptional regulator, partial [Pseudomonadota bacterium]